MAGLAAHIHRVDGEDAATHYLMMRLRRNESSMMEREREEGKRKVHSRDGKEKERVKEAARWAGSGGLEELQLRISGARNRFVQVGGDTSNVLRLAFKSVLPKLGEKFAFDCGSTTMTATFCTNTRPRRRKHLKRWFMKVCMVITNIVKICNPHDRYGDPRYDCEKEWEEDGRKTGYKKNSLVRFDSVRSLITQ